MFSISSSRIVGLIAVVCAAIVAPQALAMPIIDSQNDTPTIIAPSADAVQGYDLSGLDLSVLIGIRGYQQHEEYLRGLGQAALAATFVDTNPLGDLKSGRVVFTEATHKSVKVQSESQWQSPLGPGGIVRASKSGKAASTAAAIKALQRRSVDLDAAFRKLYPGVYRQPAPKSSNMPTNPGWGAAATAAKKSAAALAVEDRRPVVCLGQVQYDSVDLGCEWWS